MIEWTLDDTPDSYDLFWKKRGVWVLLGWPTTRRLVYRISSVLEDSSWCIGIEKKFNIIILTQGANILRFIYICTDVKK